MSSQSRRRAGSRSRWRISTATSRRIGASCAPSASIPPTISSRAGHGLDRRNFGEWVNETYDDLAETQVRETIPAPPFAEVHEAARVLADDSYINQLGWGPAIIDVYNSQELAGRRADARFAIASFEAYHTFLKLKPRPASASRGRHDHAARHTNLNRRERQHAGDRPDDL